MNHKSKSYHHGDLRNALIIAAAELIEESGSLDFAMIDAARRAGVSNAAPYRHFRDRDALLDAVAELGFIGLRECTWDLREQYTPGSRECIIAHGKAYIRFLIEHPTFYSLMWGERGSQDVEQEQQSLKTSGFYAVVNAIEAWCDAIGLRNQDPLEVAVKLWALSHGLAVLAMNQQIDKFMEQVDPYALLESTSNTFLDGLERELKL